jgi:hypothetical protein
VHVTLSNIPLKCGHGKVFQRISNIPLKCGHGKVFYRIPKLQPKRQIAVVEEDKPNERKLSDEHGMSLNREYNKEIP